MANITAETELMQAFDARVSADGSDLLVVRRSEAFELNGMGARIWELVDGRPVGQMVDQLQAEFDVDRTELEHDVIDFLGDLLPLGLVEIVDQPTGP